MKISAYEKKELLKAWLAVSLAFAILFSGGLGGLFSIKIILSFVISAFTVGIGFLLHELAHKMLAIRYGCWAEFRSDNRMLVFMIAVSFLGFVFAAPGAVMIHGNIDRVKNGKISAVGPLTNIILAILFFLGYSISTGAINGIFSYGFMINSWLAAFNMIPFWNFDGAKVFQWSRAVFGIMIGASALLVFFSQLAV